MEPSTIFILILIAAVLVAVVAGSAKKGKRGEYRVPDSPPRNGIGFVYYGVSGDQVSETLDHINMLFENQWDGIDKAIKNILVARLPTIIDVSPQIFSRHNGVTSLSPDAEKNLRDLFQQLLTNGALQFVKHAVPMDEPNLPENKVSHLLPKAVEIIRRVAREFYETKDIKVGCIYYSDLPMDHMYLFDWVGTNKYEDRDWIYAPGEIYDQIEKQLLPHQKLVIIPGATYGQDPDQSINYANLNPRVFAVIPFLWRDPHDNKGFDGIATMPEMREKYRAAGKLIVGRN